MAKLVKSKPEASTAIVKWDDELAKHATAEADREQTPSGNFVSLRSGVLSVAGTPVNGNKMQVVVLASIYENLYYEGKFDPDAPMPPACYAFGITEEELKPHEKAGKPQHDQCRGCPQNEFGSADTGKGKACKNTRRLALLSANGLTPDVVRDGAVVYMKIPVTSVKGWAHYVKALSAVMKRPPFGVITEIAVVPDLNTQFKLKFDSVGPLGNEYAGAVMKRREEVMEQITFPYQAAPEEAPVKVGKPGKRKF